ncbi:MAG: hypothetical protein GXY32_11225 [Ruminococcaceae bacterium]|nr:hypothetical protein [Oscillospiraceae bacterium]
MRRTALAIMLVGFVFVFFSIPLAGVDLLIDAVGFLLVFNGARPLEKTMPGFGKASWCAIALTVVSAAQLFLGGTVYLVLSLLRAAGEVLLFLWLMRGLTQMLKKESRLRLVPLTYGAFTLNMATSALVAVMLFVPLPALAMGIVLAVVHVLLLALLLRLALLPAP